MPTPAAAATIALIARLQGLTVAQNGFTVLGARPPPRDAAMLAFAVDTAVAEVTSLYFRYDGEAGGCSGARAFTASIGMTWSFVVVEAGPSLDDLRREFSACSAGGPADRHKRLHEANAGCDG